MVISEPALICLDASDYSVVRGFAAFWFGPSETRAAEAFAGTERPPVRAEPAPAVTAITATSQAGFEPSAETPGVPGEEEGVTEAEGRDAVPLTAQERRARAAALRGLLLGRQRRFGAAQAAFAEAARLDPTLSLESVPTFWAMERGAHEAAVRAYSDAGRTHEAAMLASRLRTTFRPRLLHPRQRTPSAAS